MINEYAFPESVAVDNDMTYSGDRGMTLRDYFAAKAMQSLVRSAPSGTIFGEGSGAANDKYASVAYMMADAMLEARK